MAVNIADTLYTLAPTDLENYRPERYDGSGFSISINDLVPADQVVIRQLYQGIKQLYDLWLYLRDAPQYDLLQQQLETLGSAEFLELAQALGLATYEQGQPSELLRKIIHDLRGGALTSLLGYTRLIGRVAGSRREEFTRLAIFLARDHAKMMRNALVDLDWPVRQADESAKIHLINDFVEKWNGLTFHLEDRIVQVTAVSTFTGAITNRCLETSSIDRIVYNYMNNAARFTADGRVSLAIFPINDTLVRWVVANQITADQAAWLAANVGDNLNQLFAGGYTRGGQGIGLSNCADFVAAGFGIRQPAEALAQGYLGAKVIDNTYYAWFHWPAYLPAAGEAICDCEE
jgi:hypothetical protein